MTRRRHLATAAAAAAALLVLGSCSDGTEQKPGSAASASGSPSSAAPEPATSAPSADQSAATVPAAPEDGACYQLGFEALAASTSGQEPVSCRDEHTTQTIRVGRLDTVVDGHAVSVTSKRAQDQMDTSCDRALRAYVGGTVDARRLSRFVVVWFRPSQDQAAAGADWFRCDLAVLAGGERLSPLPAPRRVEKVLDRRGALDTYGLCGTAAPGTAGFDRVVCARKHSWQAISTIPLSGGRAYPGASVVRRAGDRTCADQVHARVGFTLRFSYGWEWPSRDQWQRGQHYGFCWAPD